MCMGSDRADPVVVKKVAAPAANIVYQGTTDTGIVVQVTVANYRIRSTAVHMISKQTCLVVGNGHNLEAACVLVYDEHGTDRVVLERKASKAVGNDGFTVVLLGSFYGGLEVIGARRHGPEGHMNLEMLKRLTCEYLDDLESTDREDQSEDEFLRRIGLVTLLAQNLPRQARLPDRGGLPVRDRGADTRSTAAQSRARPPPPDLCSKVIWLQASE